MVPVIFKQYYSRDTTPGKRWYERAFSMVEDRLFVIRDFKNASFGCQSGRLNTKFFDGKRDLLPLFI